MPDMIFNWDLMKTEVVKPEPKCWGCGTPISVDFAPFCCAECEYEYNKVGF